MRHIVPVSKNVACTFCNSQMIISSGVLIYMVGNLEYYFHIYGKLTSQRDFPTYHKQELYKDTIDPPLEQLRVEIPEVW